MSIIVRLHKLGYFFLPVLKFFSQPAGLHKSYLLYPGKPFIRISVPNLPQRVISQFINFPVNSNTNF